MKINFKYYAFLTFIIKVFSGKLNKTALRVVGGRLAEGNEFPYVVGIEVTENIEPIDAFTVYKPHCTGSALSPHWTLSAAHCTKPDQNISLFIRYGNFYPQIMGNVSKVLQQYAHPRYLMEKAQAKYDISLFKSEKIEISRYAKLSALDYKALVGQEVSVLGFGMTNITDGLIPLQILRGALTKCDLREKWFVLQGLCLKTPCGVIASLSRGDSGGPAIHSSGVVAVVSAGSIEYQPKTKRLIRFYMTDSAGVLNTVSPVLDWISHIIETNTEHKINIT